MPDYQGELGHLLALLTELHERSFSASRVQEFCHPDEYFAILFADPAVHDRDRIGQTLSAHATNSPSTLRRVRSAVAGHGKATVVLLLSGSRGSLDLGMLGNQGGMRLLVLGMRLSLVVLLWLLLMLQPRRVSLGVLMLVGEDVLALRLEHGER